jgi:hypothetical protein
MKNTRASAFAAGTLSYRVAAFLAAMVLLAASAVAGTAAGSNSGNFTGGSVSGSNWQVGSIVTVTYANGVTAQANVNVNGNFYSPQPNNVPNGTAFTASGTEANGLPGAPTGKLAQLFVPGQNEVQTAFTLLPGSTITVGGNTYPVTGSFTSLETGFDASDNMTGSVLSAGFAMSVPAIAATITSPANIPFSINLASVDAAFAAKSFDPNFDTPVTTSVPSTTIADLQITAGAQTYDASGSATGTGYFYLNDQNQYTFDASLSNATLGSITMSLMTSAPSTLVPVPEPISIGLLSGGALALLMRRRRA